MSRWMMAVVVWALLAVPTLVSAQDITEYNQLVDRATSAHDLLQDAPEHRLDALRETALEADVAVIEWLDAFLATPDYEALPEAQQAVVVRNRYRWEYNATTLLIGLDRCESARDRVRALLDRPMNDEELRPRLTEAYDNAIACMNRPRVAYLSVVATPADAEVLVDGVLLGLATAEFEVGLGEHQVTVRAPGYIDEERSFAVDSEGERIEIADIVLAPRPVMSTSRTPTWYEWTLWGVGAAGVGVGIFYVIDGGNRQDQVDNPPNGFAVADPEGEQGTIDNMRLGGFISIGVGAAAILAGTLSFALRSNDGETDQMARDGGFELLVAPNGVAVRVPF